MTAHFTVLVQEKLNSNDNHFYQYQQNKQSPFILTQFTEQKNKIMTYDVGNPGPGLSLACFISW